MDGESGRSGAHHSCRGADGRGVLLLRKASRARRHAHRCQWPCGGTVVRGHRFASGGVSSDEARVPRHPCALSQLPDSVASIAGESARADLAADEVPAVHPSLYGRVRRDPATGHARRAAAASRHHLQAADVEDCAGDCREGACRSAGDRRGHRASGVTDARESHDDRIGRDAAGLQAADWHGQGRDYRRSAEAWQLSDLNHRGPGLLSALYAEASGHEGSPRGYRGR